MNTRLKVVNDAFSLLDENIGSKESIIRLASSAALLASLVMQLTLVDQILLVATAVYLFTTAILYWDPIYAVVKRGMAQAGEPDLVIAESKGIINTKMPSGTTGHAANDSPQSSTGMKKTG